MPIASAEGKMLEESKTTSTFLETLQLQVYPNPAGRGDNITLVLEGAYGYYQGEINIEVYSMDGRVVYRTALGKGTNSFAVPDLTAGVYVIAARIADGKKYNTRLVIH
jgi:hypothetical protein